MFKYLKVLQCNPLQVVMWEETSEWNQAAKEMELYLHSSERFLN